ncbi:MAG: hypothetical protein CL666_01370 [Balneola sp.]|nr:hypothetical protein [Balneola sp.]|tara:strand:+ start:15155 stop:16444 length:1290 start_codon:yes stop_codon:yes gene_type:complete
MNWNDKVKSVFTTYPRNGDTKNTFWIEREEQKALRNYLSQEDHICIDGPTGSGKSSLVITNLYRENIKHAMIQLTGELTWTDFCKQLVDPKIVNTNNFNAGFEIGVSGGLPEGKLSFSLGSSGDELQDLEYLLKKAESWTEHDLCRELQDKDITLVIDDTERCSDTLLKRLSDVAKIQIQSYPSKNARLVFIGAGGVLSRLLNANDSLGDRINHLSIGAFQDKSYSWHFLVEGFNRLGMRNPTNSKFKSEIERTAECKKTTYYAADGLPKSLNKLGKNIALFSGHGNHASAATIINESKKMFQQNWRIHSKNYTSIANLLRSDYVAELIIKELWDTGIGAVHYLDQMEKKIVGSKDENGNEITNDKFYSIIDELMETNFLTVSGSSKGIVFATNPSSAHTFGVAMHNRSLFSGASKLLSGLEQLELEFG